jgi:drug/metabolite transporter (DMT)-like permease
MDKLVKIANSIHYIWWVLSYLLFFAFGEYFSKKLALNPQWSYFFLATLPYFIATLFWIPAILQKNSISILSTMIMVSSFMIALFVGIIIFKEQVTIMGIIGIALAFLSVVCLTLA